MEWSYLPAAVSGSNLLDPYFPVVAELDIRSVEERYFSDSRVLEGMKLEGLVLVLLAAAALFLEEANTVAVKVALDIG